MISNYLTTWINSNYSEIELMAQKITRGHPETPDLLHYSLLHFMEHGRAEELVKGGQAMKFLSGIMWRSFWSGTSAYHTEYRQKGIVHAGETPEVAEDPYDDKTDLIADGIRQIIDEMKGSGDLEKWFHATLFLQWMDEPNYSKLSRVTGIPRTSISHGVRLAREYIKKELKKSGLIWNG